MMLTQEKTYAKIYEYPDGSYDIVTSTEKKFKEKTLDKKPRKAPQERLERVQLQGKAEDVERAMRRARANVRRLALANEFKYFVTLTVDPAKIDSYDVAAVQRRLSQWLSNHVRRHGLVYVLVPEFHESGRVHYHGFFNDAISVVDSGHRDSGGHVVYNMPDWIYGFTTAIELYGDRHAAVGYCTKYIGKGNQKIGGRWYLSGGALKKPVEKYVDISLPELLELQTEEFTQEYGEGWIKTTPGGMFAGINGLNKGAIL